MSNNLCEVPMKRSIRGNTSNAPNKVGLPETNMVNPKLCEDESVYETSILDSISKRRYGIQMGGNPQPEQMGMKSSHCPCKCLWLSEYKPSTSIEGARSAKTGDQIHKDSCPELGCSGDLSFVVVHPVNVGTSCFGRETGLAAVDVKHEGRSSRSSRSKGKPCTWRRTTANCQVPKEIGNEVGKEGFPSLEDGICHYRRKRIAQKRWNFKEIGGEPCAMKVASTVR